MPEAARIHPSSRRVVVTILALALASALWAVLVFGAAWFYLRPGGGPELARRRGSGEALQRGSGQA